MILADTLSRLPNPANNKEVELDVRIDYMDIKLDLINFGSFKQEELKKDTNADPELNILKPSSQDGQKT